MTTALGADTLYSVGSGGSSVYTTGGKFIGWGVNHWGAGIPIPTEIAPSNPYGLPGTFHLDVDERTRDANGDHQCVGADDGKIYCRGGNTVGQLGNAQPISGSTPSSSAFVAPSGTNAYISVSIGGQSSCALGANGKAYCWGKNDVGQVGNETTSSGVNTPQSVTMPKGVNSFSAIVAGNTTSCALTPP